ncbi:MULTISPECIES: Nmad5 family putative nucleotide modification protein [unclassified Rhizobium]|jgi:hypothetical protein|uniref:Nmad5 family putative nucleotide modification protein n=1 Tax=unclassified Rhizobium TaxID=2613769 RepID=UPI00069067C2|nr:MULTISPECIES: Nmad5 family putative nucleotide modification protein [unclassified Rhizobium]OJY66411.1 MAG: hypothetical protein BGP09_31260 [Rhizobium sp. 60-20]RKD69007.1 hypothetical protein BJ928_104145 [Rhizobium sp. WW_1]
MSTRLTKDIREAIAKDLIKHRFEDAVKNVYAQRAALADAVYRDIYTKTQREQIEALPDGMLPTVDDLSVNFGTSYTHVYFSGYSYGDLNKVVSADRTGSYRRVYYKHKGGSVKVYDATHKLAVEYDRLSGVAADLVNEIDVARRSAIAAMASVGTIKRLIEAWPEVAPFARRFDVERPQLPMVQTDKLNKILDLPVSEAA